MTLREYARHRGCSLSAVQIAINDNRISVDKTERHGKQLWKFVDSEKADRDWASNTDVDQQRNPTRAERGIQTAASTRSPTYVEDDAEPLDLFPEMNTKPLPEQKEETSPAAGGIDYLMERARKEHFAAKRAELDYYKEIETLVHKDTIKVMLFNQAQAIQQNLFNLPSRVSSILAAYLKSVIDLMKTDPDAGVDEKEIQDIITGELKIVLRRIGEAGNGI